MLTHIHRDSTERSTLHEVQKPQGLPQTAAAKPSCGDNSTDPAFGLLMGQLLGMTAPDAQQTIQGQQSPGDSADAISENMPASAQAVSLQTPDRSAQDQGEVPTEEGAAAAKLSKAVSRQTPDSSRMLLGVQDQGDAPKEEKAAEKIANALSGDTDKKKSAEDLMTETPSSIKKRVRDLLSGDASRDKAGNDALQASDDKKPLHGTAQAGEDPAAQKDAILIAALKDNSEPHHPADKNAAIPNATDAVTMVKHDPSAVQGHTAGIRSVDAAGGIRSFHVSAADPAEMYATSFSVVRDGNKLQVRLEPAELGKLDINLNLKDGIVHAQINVQHDATKDLLEKNAQQLVDSLLKEGLSVGGFSVSLQKGDAWEGAAENKQGTGGAVAEVRQNTVVGRAPAVSSLVNIFV